MWLWLTQWLIVHSPTQHQRQRRRASPPMSPSQKAPLKTFCAAFRLRSGSRMSLLLPTLRDGWVFAIRGAWGYGKSSLKNLVIEQLAGRTPTCRNGSSSIRGNGVIATPSHALSSLRWRASWVVRIRSKRHAARTPTEVRCVADKFAEQLRLVMRKVLRSGWQAWGLWLLVLVSRSRTCPWPRLLRLLADWAGVIKVVGAAIGHLRLGSLFGAA